MARVASVGCPAAGTGQRPRGKSGRTNGWPAGRSAGRQGRCGDKSAWGRLCTRSTTRSEEHTSELQSHVNLVCRLLLEKKDTTIGEALLGEMSDTARVLFPLDENT